MKKVTMILAVCMIAVVAAQGQASAEPERTGRVTGLPFECKNAPNAHAYEIRSNFRCGKARGVARAWWDKAIRKEKGDIWVKGFRCTLLGFDVNCHTKSKRRVVKWTGGGF